MIKLSFDKKCFLDRNARRKHQKKIRRRLFKAKRTSRDEGQTITIDCPAVFSLTKNYSKTVDCIRKLREQSHQEFSHAQRTKIGLYDINDLEPAAALVLAAELDRGQRLRGGHKLHPIKLSHWRPEVLQLFYELGLFKLLDISPEEVEKTLQRRRRRREIPPHRVALSFVTDERNNREQTDKLCDDVEQMAEEYKLAVSEKDRADLVVALAEASLNSFHHAYPTEERVKRWWAAATYDRDRKTVRYFVYDQGVGIANTLNRTHYGKSFLSRYINLLQNKHEGFIIKSLIENPLPRSGEEHRGKGFPQMLESCDREGAMLRIQAGKVTFSIRTELSLRPRN